jgi:hypothetical protein
MRVQELSDPGLNTGQGDSLEHRLLDRIAVTISIVS